MSPKLRSYVVRIASPLGEPITSSIFSFKTEQEAEAFADVQRSYDGHICSVDRSARAPNYTWIPGVGVLLLPGVTEDKINLQPEHSHRIKKIMDDYFAQEQKQSIEAPEHETAVDSSTSSKMERDGAKPTLKGEILFMSDRSLAFLGIGLYVLQVLTSATDDKGSTQTPDILILLSGVAGIIFVTIVSVRLWRGGTKIEAIILPLITFASEASLYIQTPNPSNTNLIVSGLKVGAFLAYFYAILLLFAFNRQQKVDS